MGLLHVHVQDMSRFAQSPAPSLILYRITGLTVKREPVKTASPFAERQPQSSLLNSLSKAKGYNQNNL